MTPPDSTGAWQPALAEHSGATRSEQVSDNDMPSPSTSSAGPAVLSCPFFIDERARGVPRSCTGLNAKTMSEVRKHLRLPLRDGRPHLDFLKRCPTCKEDVINEGEFTDKHGPHGELCGARKEARGAEAMLVSWTSLYLKLLAAGVVRSDPPHEGQAPQQSPLAPPLLPHPLGLKDPATTSEPFGMLSCSSCEATFTGEYARGNLARHNKYRHSTGRFSCEAPGCDRHFLRPDARRAHYRRAHPELYLPPLQPREQDDQSTSFEHMSEPPTLQGREKIDTIAYTLNDGMPTMESDLMSLSSTAPTLVGTDKHSLYSDSIYNDRMVGAEKHTLSGAIDSRHDGAFAFPALYSNTHLQPPKSTIAKQEDVPVPFQTQVTQQEPLLLRESEPTKSFFCTYCNEVGKNLFIRSKQDWKRHQEDYHETGNIWHCQVEGCQELFPQGILFKAHLKNHNSKMSPKDSKRVVQQRRLYACGFEHCREIKDSWRLFCDHVFTHMKEGRSDWSYNRTILNLLKHPKVATTWKSVCTEHGTLFNCRPAELGWDVKTTKEMRQTLASQNFGSEQLREFLRGVFFAGLPRGLKENVLPLDQGRLGVAPPVDLSIKDVPAMYENLMPNLPRSEKTRTLQNVDPSDLREMVVIRSLGNIYWNQGKLDDAEKTFRRVVQGCEVVLGRDHMETLQTMNSMGNLLKDRGKLNDAEAVLHQALQSCEKVLGYIHTLTLEVTNNLGTVLRAQGKLYEAGRMHERALRGYEELLGEELIRSVADTPDVEMLHE